MKSKNLFSLLILIAFLTVCFETAEACRCLRQETCQNFSRAKVDFVGKVLDSTELTRKVTRTEQPIGGEVETNEYEESRQISRIMVEENFAGAAAQKEILKASLERNKTECAIAETLFVN